MNRIFLLLGMLFANLLFAEEVKEREMVIVIPSYNNSEWYDRNLFSAMWQYYSNFRIIYINDCSTDGTGELVAEMARCAVHPDSFRIISFDDGFTTDINEIAAKFEEEVNRQKVFFTLVNNTSRSGALSNLYRATRSCGDDDIVLTLDGDDWLSDNMVLKRLNAVYGSGEIWMTHGTLIEYPHMSVTWCEPVPPELIERNEVRQFKCPSHLRTYYAWLFKKIALEDLLYDGKFFPVTGDMAIMFPILEMAGERHAFIEEPNYVYNMSNPINDHKVQQDLQNEMDRYIRSKKPYPRLKKAG